MDRLAFNNLVAQAIAGDKAAMNAVISESFQDIHFYARKILKDADQAADAAQNSCIEIIESIGNLRESAAFVTWSRRIVYHQCMKLVGTPMEVPLEANEDGETILDSIADLTPGTLPEEVVENEELRQILLGMIDVLPEHQRSAMMLYYYEQLHTKDIASIQGAKLQDVKNWLYHGRKAVGKQVEAYEKKTGIKLHSVAVAPLLYFLFHSGKTETDAASAALLPQVLSAVAPSVVGTAGAGAAAATGAAVGASLVIKIAAAAIATVLVVGGVVIGMQSGNQSTGEEKSETSYSEPSAPTDPNLDEAHPFQHYAFDDEAHWLLCDCEGATDTRQAHTFADGECTVCHMPQPLPGGNPYLTYDTTILGGHWLAMPLDTVGDAAEEFYINGDGSLYMNGTTYYPVGSRQGDAPVGEPSPLLIYFRQIPYDPQVGITETEAYSAPLLLELKSIDDRTVISLSIIGADVYIAGKYYRESDYFGYEKLELTMDNYQDYLTITIDPISCGYSYMTFYANTGIQFTLKEGLGAASCCVIEGSILAERHIISSNIQTQEHDLNEIPFGEETTNLRVSFYGTSYNKYIQIMSGETVPVNNIVEWYGYIPKDVEISSVSGFVFVPKQ